MLFTAESHRQPNARTSTSLMLIVSCIVALSIAIFHPTAASAATTTVDLSGTWNFTPQGGTATTIQVPGGGWYKQGFTSVSEATYARSITIPNTGQPQDDVVTFGAINHQATLSINGTVVGTNMTAFTPSSFDITNYVTPGQTYTLSVDVKGRNALKGSDGKYLVPDAAEWSEAVPQGIYRSATLYAYPQVRISDVFVRPSVTITSLSYDVSVTNASGSTQSIALGGNLTSWNGSSWSYPTIGTTTASIPAHATRTVTVGPIHWGLGSGSYWWPNVPYVTGYHAQLHNLNLTLSVGGATVDQNTTRFGFREFDQSGNTYTLNGVRVNLRGDDLQGADYDRINYGGGNGDAYDTLPGFLPPSSGNGGWPQAVDNFEHLNYNVIRIHQEPTSPYMLDTLDEMGMMVIEESAIRGSSNLQNFVTGHDNMVNHVKALVQRDRNHPAIIRWSQANEPDNSSTDSQQFELDLYNAITGLDPTRPVSIDAGGNAQNYNNEFPQSNFAAFAHYGGNGTFGAYTDNVYARSDKPFGEGEYIWPADKTKNGFTLFATATQGMRVQNASDARPYTLLSAWAGVIPGVKTTDFTLEQGGHSLYGADNLSDPWSNPQIQRVQAGFNPVLVADKDYWATNKNSDSNGDWPATIPVLNYSASVTRTLDIYNDTFSGTTVNVSWETHLGSPTGTLVASGALNPTVALGTHSEQTITFTTPSSGTELYLVLIAKKGGTELFRENNEVFALGTPVAGTQLFYDDFEDSSTSQWTPTSGTWSICQPPNNSHEYCKTSTDTAGDTALSSAGTASWTNYSVQSYVNFANTSGSTAILGRFQDATHYYDAEMHQNGNGTDQVQIWKNNGNTWTLVAAGNYTYAANTYYLLKLDLNGSTLTASVSANHGSSFQTVTTGSDTTFTAGKIGLRAWGTPANFDAVQVIAD